MNKRLIAIFVCMAVFVLTLVIGAVMFTVSDVNILITADDTFALDKSKILEVSGIKKGQSVFTIDSDKAEQNIEKNFPALQAKVERAPLNKVRIQLKTRIPVFKVRIANTDNYAVLDRDLKIVDIVTNHGSDYGNDKIILISGYEYFGGENPCGDFIVDQSNDIVCLKSIILSLEQLGVVNQRMPALFSNFQIISGTNKRIEMKMLLGITMVIWTDVVILNSENSIQYQCDLLYSHFYNKMSEDEREMQNYLYFTSNGVQLSPTLDLQ